MYPPLPMMLYIKEDEAMKERTRPKDQFQAAAYGSYCRSSRFLDIRGSYMEENWMEAIQTTPGQWSVFRVSVDIEPKADGQGQDRKSVNKVKTDEGLSFIKALTYVAEFEAVCRERMVPDPDSEQEIDYYKNFGRREGLAFDQKTHRPLRTMQGHIIEEGCVDYSEMDALRKAWMSKQSDFLTATAELNTAFANDIDPKALDCIFVGIETFASVKKLKTHFDTLAEKYKNLMRYDFSSKQCYDFEQELKGAKECVESDFSDSDDMHLKLSQYLRLVEIHYKLGKARAVFNNYRQSEAVKAEDMKADIFERANDIRQMYLSLGGDPVEITNIAADIIRSPASASILPPSIEKICQQVNGIYERAQELKTNQAVAALGREEWERLSSKRGILDRFSKP